MKFLHTGSRMKATSTCRMRAAVRAMTGRQVMTGRCVVGEKILVKSKPVLPGEDYVPNPYPNAALASFKLSFSW